MTVANALATVAKTTGRMTHFISKIKNFFHKHRYKITTIHCVENGIIREENGFRHHQENYQKLMKTCRCGKIITQRIK